MTTDQIRATARAAMKAREIRAAATALGALGAAKGGRARAARMPPEERSEQARRAVLVRWKRRRLAGQHLPDAGV